MADSFTAKLNLTKPEVGASTDTWGTKINTDLDTIDGLFDTGPYLKVAKGGTGAGTAADARTNLGLGTLATKSAVTSADITDGTIVYADIQNISATSRVLGRKTSGAGTTEELTLSDVLDFVGSSAQGDILYRGASSWARLGAGTSGQALLSGGAAANPSWGTLSIAPDVIVEDQKTSGTGGGTATAGAWTTRTLNTLYRNANSLASLSSNKVTLPVGTYYITARAPFWYVGNDTADDGFRLRLFNVTDNTTERLGFNTGAHTGSSPDRPNSIDATLTAILTVSGSSKEYRLDYYINNLRQSNTRNLGVENNLGTEIYTSMSIWKIA